MDSRKIDNPYDAYWFLHDHPAFTRTERDDLPADGDEKPIEHTSLYTDRNGNHYRVWDLITVPAIVENLDIHYAKVDETRTINDDKSKNLYTECWLEFGPVEYGYHGDWEEGREYKQHYHDPDLDCGASTFDEALVILANKVLEKYGDYDK